ncbi:adhesion G-protein coupled receptor G4 [Amphiprion ocellaris]|uniref:adhesion G-protein coupled receptor G4 n=1 Tax=Amphiprion ocellaris TaxID=80972 RepID=UPI001649C7DF|nr:adhesion G-protein coupled receptor G4 [Amphiprion ocellaris]
MIFLKNRLMVFITVSILSSLVTTMERVPWPSLWGTVADFTFGCSHWRLKPQVFIPALQEFTVCLELKLQMETSSQWTAFMYRHPEVQHAELGLGGKSGRLVVWLFGQEWTTTHIDLHLSQWYSLCVTWSHTRDRPALYVNRNAVAITLAHNLGTPSLIPPLCCKLTPNGSLTLGASHILVDGKIQVLPFNVWGKISLFRMWARERSKEEVTSLNCTEGDLVKWEWDNWDTQICAPLSDSSLQCEWSIYKVTLMFAIIRHDSINTELYTARDIAHHWLRVVLPNGIYLNRVSVFEATRSSMEDLVITYNDSLIRWAPNTDRFDCLVYVNVIPSWDVVDVQTEMYTDLKMPYNDPSGVFQLLADPNSIYTTPVESLTSATTSPPTTTSSSTSLATANTFTTSPANMSELYFEVKMNVSITGDYDSEQILAAWLNCSLPDDSMIVLNLQYERPNPVTDLPYRHPYMQANPSTFRVSTYTVSRKSCVFQVEVVKLQSNTQEMEEQIRQILLMPYNNGSVSIATEDIQIKRILILKCDAETHQTRKGLFMWPNTSGGKNAVQTCPRNPERHATRHCKLCVGTHWMDPDLDDCSLVVETIPDLDHVIVTADNALDVVKMIKDLLKNQTTLNYQELATVLNKLEDIINVSLVTPSLGQALINIISDILESDSNLVPFTNTILNITEAVGDNMVGYENSSTLVAPAVAISVVDVASGQFNSLTFGVSSDWAGTKPEIFINKYPFNGTVAFISLPSVLQNSFPQYGPNQNPPRIQFQFYGIPMLFKSSQKGQILNTFVVSASVTNASSPIKDLTEDVKVTLHHRIPNTLQKTVQCVYWNFNKNNGHGGWDDRGCRKYNSSSEYTTCLCDHLTHFGVLLDVSRTQVDPVNEQILTIITYLGCGVSSLFLGITVLTYTAFEKLRRDYPSQILINLSLAMLGLNLVFLVNSWLSSWGLHGLCVAVASTLHYFLLASFTWMGLEAVNMYFALVKVFNVYVPSYILKFCALGWGLPLGICILVLIVNREAYGSNLYTNTPSTLELLDNSGNFCWLQDNVTFYVSVVAYAVLIFLFNIGVFVVVLIQIRQMRVNSPAGTRSGLMHDLKGVASLTLLLGLTWTVGFCTFGPGRIVMLYLFAALNTLQGLFIFIFHCLMKENVRKQWRIHLCFGRFRLEEHSEWSNSASVGVLAKPRPNPPRASVPSVPSVRSVKSSSTNSTSASSDSSQRESAFKRPNLDLFVNPPALPRAQRNPAGTGAVPSYRGMNPTPGWRNHLLDRQEQR